VDDPYVPGTTVVLASFAVVILLSMIVVVVITPGASVGFGYVPASAPPAGPPGVVPVIVVLAALTRRPAASTVNVATCVAEPYVPVATPVSDIFAEVTALFAMSTVETVPSAIFVDVIADVATVGFG
jgi:hypothetical protein